MSIGPVGALERTAGGFMDALKREPLSLALCVMNLTLLGYLFYEGSSVNAQRNETSKQIIDWQVRTDVLMASCVSKDVMELVIGALERDRELYRRLLPQQPAPP